MMEDSFLQQNGADMQSQNHAASSHDDVEGKIFVGGLSWQTTQESMRFHFEKYGELSDIAIMIDKRTGQPRGFGFITMKDPAAADIVVSTEHTIDGRVVDVKRAVPRDMAPAPTRAESKKVFVGGLPTEVTEKEFADYFGTFGLVKDVVVMVDRATNRSRGFGFVTFETEEAVESVMRNKCELMGKWIEVKRAEPRDSSINIRGPGNMMGGPMGMQSDGYSNSGRGGMGSGGGAYGGQGPRGGYSGRGMQDNSDQMQQSYGGQQIQQQNYNMQQGYGGFRGGVSNVNGGNAGVRYPAGYGGTSAASGMNMGMNRGISGQGQGQGVYPNPQMYAQQSQPVGFYGYGFSGATGQPMAGAYGAANDTQGSVRPIALSAEGGPGPGYTGSGVMQQAYGYNSTMAAYGGAYNLAAGYGGAAVAQQGGPQGGPPRGGPIGQDASFNEAGGYGGAFRGHGATQGRVDRSYRPY